MKQGFTLIELIVTMSIIVLMALVAVPAFTKYEENASFNAKVAEIESAINQASVSALNAEQNIAYYAISTDTSLKKVSIYKADTVDKTITMSSSIATVTLQQPSKPFLKFNAGKSFVCIQSNSTDPCSEGGTNINSGDYISIIGTNNTTKIINIVSNPVRVTVKNP